MVSTRETNCPKWASVLTDYNFPGLLRNRSALVRDLLSNKSLFGGQL